MEKTFSGIPAPLIANRGYLAMWLNRKSTVEFHCYSNDNRIKSFLKTEKVTIAGEIFSILFGIGGLVVAMIALK